MTIITRQVLAVATIAAASLLSAGAALAQEATPDTWLQAAQSTKSRADVAKELAEARKTAEDALKAEIESRYGIVCEIPYLKQVFEINAQYGYHHCIHCRLENNVLKNNHEYD